ncbi:MAG: hypothetical protein GX575_33165 [Candidatus Anammoximicrobium sp.]|nr:hypothetical protein [Candidatus Anammoximicrobium sp.]
MLVRTLEACALALVFVCLAGCGGGELCQVQGTAKLKDGTPLARGRVIFTGGPAGANGRIQEDGSFAMGTLEDADGAKPGQYTVVVVGATTAETRSYEDMMKGIGQPPKSLIHARYGSAETSDLKFEVKPGKNTLTLELDPP